MKNLLFNLAHLYTSDFRKLKLTPKETAKLRDDYVIVSLHTHSKPNEYLLNAPEQLIDLISYCRLNKVRILALTDHEKKNIDNDDELRTDQRFEQILKMYEAESNSSALTIKNLQITILKSKELWSNNYTHILGIGYKGEIKNNHSLTLIDLAERIKEHSGWVYIPHPFNTPVAGITKKDLVALINSNAKPDMLEGFNSQNIWPMSYFNKKAIKFGREHKIPLVTGADARFPQYISYGHILVPAGELDVRNSEIKQALFKVIENRDYLNYASIIPVNYVVQGFYKLESRLDKPVSFFGDLILIATTFKEKYK